MMNHERASIDPKTLARVRALLAKAEATPFPAESEAFTAKAQEIMAAHSIERAMLDGPQTSVAPASLVIVHESPYASQKSSLLSAIARPNGCTCVWSPDSKRSTVFGFEHDLAAIELLFTSLLVQAGAEMLNVETTGQHDPSRVRSFRASFYLGFAGRIGQRLQRIRDLAAEAAARDCGTDVLPVLASRDVQVQGAMEQAFPHLRTQRVSLSNGGGYRAGRVAADRANLGPAGARLRRAG